MVKIVRFDNTGVIVDRKFEPRDYSVPVGQQVSGLLAQERQRDSSTRFRICSSANGGLRLGIFALTSRFSGEVAKRIALTSGCNVIWAEARDCESLPMSNVDAQLIVGGLDVADCPDHRTWLDCALSLVRSDIPLLFAGNERLAEYVRTRSADCFILNNILSDDMRVQPQQLSRTLRELYMRDLVHKDGISSLQPLSEIPIWPTPAVCERAFRHHLSQRTTLSLGAPLLMMDLGGATTDIYYGVELLRSADGHVADALGTYRYVFASTGVRASRASTLSRLGLFSRLYDLLNCVFGQDARRYYASIRDNDTQWITDELMFYFCIGLVLAEAQSGSESGHPLALERISTLVITGGAAKVCDPAIIGRIFSIFTPRGSQCAPHVYLDRNYQIWTDGIRQLPLNNQHDYGDAL